MTSWEEQSSEQATAERPSTYPENKLLERNEPEEFGNKPDGTQTPEMGKGAENQSDLRDRSQQETEKRYHMRTEEGIFSVRKKEGTMPRVATCARTV